MNKIKIYGASILRKKTQLVQEIDSEIRKLIAEMSETMYENEGVGLAANQIGVDKQVMVVDIGEGLLTLINPEIIETEGEEIAEEGCLSIPDIRIEFPRAERIKVTGLNSEGKKIAIEADGLLARVLQHEIDHLNGILIIDRIGFARRQMLEKKLKRLE